MNSKRSPFERSYLRAVLSIAVLEITILPTRAEQEPASVADSKKQNTFVRRVPVPSNFVWEGHTIAFDECWIDRTNRGWLDRTHPGKDYLLVTIKIDGKRAQERHIEKKENKSINFERADGLKPIAFKYCRSQGLFGQRRIYFVELAEPQPKEITLNVETTRMKDFRPITTNTGSITFSLP